MYIHPAIANAYKIMDGVGISFGEALALTTIEGEDILDLVSLANKARVKFAAEIAPCSIINAKSGACDQNCRFCAQANAHETGAEIYALLPLEKILEGAREAHENGARAYGIVTSGRGYETPNAEFKRILEALDAIAAEFPNLGRCVSLGILSDECARLLAEHGAQRYNMNLQTAPERYAEFITDKHSIGEKLRTIKRLRELGVSVCCGGILGLGESWTDRVRLAFACKESGADGIPLNVLLPIKGTALEGQTLMNAADTAKAFSLFRLVNPSAMIKFAAGRETVMKDFQGLLMLAGMNSMITGGYLTTRGRGAEDDRVFIAGLAGFGHKKRPSEKVTTL